MRPSTTLMRSSKGYGWYKKFVEKGPEHFRKRVPPTAFNWDALDRKRPQAFFTISLDKQPIGDLTFELADDVVPKTVNNFMALCNGSSKYKYSGTKIHLIHKGVSLMGGDVEKNDGTGNHSANEASKLFPDENFIIPHTERGLIRCVLHLHSLSIRKLLMVVCVIVWLLWVCILMVPSSTSLLTKMEIIT